ncbi:hypothetical protein E3N88_08914 [Mikania micrantha]|uniref:Uncharacterized protein n=1 Tax=Mikania micrantha TaxID=192012 RepID=A0A5N6PIK5_9ASTR|nr:hypothetical protein E3N88_08914 [Mikania micrantha]
MAATSPATVAVRMLVAIFGCLGIFAFSYGFAMDRYSSCLEAHNREMKQQAVKRKGKMKQQAATGGNNKDRGGIPLRNRFGPQKSVPR